MLFLTGIIVILVGLVGLFVLSGVDATREPAVDLEIDVANATVGLTHAGGDALPQADGRLVLGADDDAAYGLENLTEVRGDDDGRFEPGERLEATHDAGSILDVTVVHEPTNGVLASGSFDVPTLAQSALRWDSATDWDAATAETGVVHEGYGDRTADRIELGYPSAGAVAFWPLDEDGGSTATDISGSNDGTIEDATIGVGGVTETTGFEFDGTDDYVSGATDLPALRRTASISMWVNTTATGDATMWQAPGVTGVESAGDGDDIFWGWLDDQGRIGVQAGDQPAAVSANPINDGTWHHVVLTRNHSSGRVEVYVDGTLSDAATSRSGEITTTFDSLGRIEDTAGTPEFFPGRLEEVRVYDRVLDAGAVSSLSDSATTGRLTTAGKPLADPVNASELRLTDVETTRPSAVTVTVESDPDGDGTYEESSDPISLDGSGSYDVTGLTTPSRRFRLHLAFDSPATSESPSFDGATLRVDG